MAASLSWLDHDSAAKDRSLRILALFTQKESRDELGAHWQPGDDPWKIMFDLAKQERKTDLKTFWLFETEGGARIERRVPLLPPSREQVHLNHLKRGLALYRLVFGQPRQEELSTHLNERLLTQEQRKLASSRWRIDLTPPDVAKTVPTAP